MIVQVTRVCGPSPPVRGKQVSRSFDLANGRSIPARAGEAAGSPVPAGVPQVHPRPCGGSQTAELQAGPLPRSIPARAGEAGACGSRTSPSSVHPRPCGGSRTTIHHVRRFRGPSPPVRGKLFLSGYLLSSRRSIPARAGEAVGHAVTHSREWVHPRPCGGSSKPTMRALVPLGPSPPVRGKRRSGRHQHAVNRSIPARAGEALRKSCMSSRSAVHPRPCGGSGTGHDGFNVCYGPSPPVRGKRFAQRLRVRYLRSIPARAGEAQPT